MATNMEFPRGEITKTIYSHIKEGQLHEAIEILQQLLEQQPKSRSALSLLGYCHFQTQNFVQAAFCYEMLTELYPDIPDYQLYLAQSLYNTTNYEEALAMSHLKGEADEDTKEKSVKLQSAIQYCRNEPTDSKSLIESCKSNDAFKEIALGCLEYKDENFSSASQHFETASNIVGFEPLLWYNRAVTFYQLGDLPAAAQYIGEIIEQGVIEHPEFRIGSATDENEISSVGNSRSLQETALIEALNLKAAIEFDLQKKKAAKDTMSDLPPRLEEELDPITLHNLAILYSDTGPVESIRKLRYLLDQNTFPPDAFRNLLILYYRFGQYDLIADLMAVYDEYKMKYLCPNTRRFFEAIIKSDVAPEEASKLLEEFCSVLAENMRKLVKKLQTSKGSTGLSETKKIVNEFDEIVDGMYMPALMALGKIYWDKEDFSQVEKTLRQGAEFLDDKDPWISNVAHTMYHKGVDFKGAAGLYELVVRKHQTTLLDVSAISLANLCVSYVLISRNEEAERLIQNVEIQEAELLPKSPEEKIYHSCIINLVIGTLYCCKKNYDFGIDRIIKSLEDFKNKLSADTWYYAKRSILSLIEKIAKNSVSVQEDVIKNCIGFLVKCEEFGKTVSTVINEDHTLPTKDDSIPVTYGKQFVTYEARVLRYLLTQCLEWGLT